ncbi:RNA polymerase II transcription factor SIII subunit A-domain-containing protein [Irpex rosettiformis]|uniref:RNA polymerase II transcription factor SIII subunit A-domain-containing protein n=1 Tax=Irpex rosettiformis TaxID=378272 RepID=A0ACB8TVX3_9APHY|nr:RNA polymerase II transcription factor SIII subunit A-domain-containing protein [Irpex rosettiformis]
MNNEGPHTTRRVSSLVSFCQRDISSLGEDMPIDLIRPILQNCSADVLVRFEQASPVTWFTEMWKALCSRSFPLMTEQHFAAQEPECWRDAYFRLRDFEKERLDAVAAKLRGKREEERKRKEGTQIKFTDKTPPVKRSRGSGLTTQKTLFQKTVSEASKVQKGVYAARKNPSMLIPKTTTFSASIYSTSSLKPTKPTFPSSIPVSSGNTTGTRVTVTSVPKPNPSASKTPATSFPNPKSSIIRPTGDLTLSSSVRSNVSVANSPIRRTAMALPLSQKPGFPRPPGELRTLSPKVRKDPTSVLFLPRPRVQPPVPTHSNSMRSRA